MNTHHLARSAANLINPLLAVLLLAAPLVLHQGRALPWRYWLRSAGALLLVFVVAHLNRWLHLWHAQPMFPSGHAAFAACAATSLAVLDRRTLLFTIPLMALQTVLILTLRYHVPLDIAGALLIAPPLTWICHRGATEQANATTPEPQRT